MKHKKIKHTPTNNKIICELCNKEFTRNDNLKYHKKNSCKFNYV